MGFLKGKSRSQQQAQSTNSSENRAYGFIQDNYGTSGANTYNSANSAISNLLGLNGNQGQDEGFQKYLDSTGYKFNLDTGSKAITGNAAAAGLLNSGATLKRLNQYGQELGGNYFSKYLDQLFNLSQSGLGAGQLLSGSGGISQGQSTSSGSSSKTEGLGDMIGTIGAAVAASDRRLKTDITQIGQLQNGLNVYDFTYKHTGERATGVMVDEVSKLAPSLLGPVVFGYGTVNYSTIANEIDSLKKAA